MLFRSTRLHGRFLLLSSLDQTLCLLFASRFPSLSLSRLLAAALEDSAFDFLSFVLPSLLSYLFGLLVRVLLHSTSSAVSALGLTLFSFNLLHRRSSCFPAFFEFEALFLLPLSLSVVHPLFLFFPS